MKTKIHTLMASFVVASVAFMGAMGSANAADEWFVLGEQTIKSADPSVDDQEPRRSMGKDVKQVKISVEGADVQITKVVLHWDNRTDDTLTNVGTLKSGGQTAPNECPGTQGAPEVGDGPVQDPW